MEILHVIPVNGTYIVPLANMLRQYDKENTHTFFVTTVFQAIVKSNVDLLQIKGLECVPHFSRHAKANKMKYILNFVKKADHVVWHTFRTNDGYIPFLLYMNRSLLKKSTWIPAEGEIGNYMNVHSKFLNRFAKRVNAYVQRHVTCIGLEHPCDQKMMDMTGQNISSLPYPNSSVQEEALAQCLQDHEGSRPKKALCVQLGLSSQSDNKHAYLIETLSQLQDHANAVAFIPFTAVLPGTRHASGSKMNQNKIRNKAKQLECCCTFPNKVMDTEAYLKLISQMDVVLLGNSLCVQMHTLFCLLASHTRVFLPQGEPLYQYLNDAGANVYSIEQLSELGSLAAAMELPASRLPAQLQDYYSDAKVMECWARWSRLIMSR